MNKVFKKIVVLIKLSFYAHHQQFDVIRFGEGPRFEEIQKCYLFSLILFICNALYGIFGLECESRPVCQIDWAVLANSPYNFYHQMFPRAVWPQTNMMMVIVISCCIGCWIGFLLNPPIGKRFLIYPDSWDGGNKKDELDRMCLFRTRFLKLASAMEVGIDLTAIVFLYGMVLFVNSVYNVNLTSIIFWGLLNPFNIYYDALFIYVVSFYVILASKYVTIQQKALQKRLMQINAKLLKAQTFKTRRKRTIYIRLWLDYMEANCQISNLCQNMREYARFWSPYLTVLLMTFISLQCYLFYAFLFVPTLSPVLRAMLFIAVFGIVFDQFVLITQCAQVVTNFKRLTRLNRTFYQCYNKLAPTSEIRPSFSRNLAKAETLKDTRLLHSYAFFLFGNYRITNKSFHIIISYISIFFLYIVKNKH